MGIEIRLLCRDDNRSRFTCGDPDLDLYIREFAGQHQFRHRLSATWLAVEDAHVLGFVTVTPGTLAREEAPRVKLPLHSWPILKLARMGVETAHQDRGIGRRLLYHVLQMGLDLSQSYGCVGVYVDAKPRAVRFYERHAFHRLTITEVDAIAPMFLSIRTIQGAIQAGAQA